MLISGMEIPLDSIDMFWKKLDISPAYEVESQTLDINRELELMRQHIVLEPEEIQRNIFANMWESIKPWKTTKKDPAVKKNNRGRPRKDKQKEVDPARHSSFENFHSFSGRHSSAVDMDPFSRGHSFDPRPGRHSVHGSVNPESFLTLSSVPPETPYNFFDLSQEDLTQGSFMEPPIPPRQTTYQRGDENRYNYEIFKSYIPAVFHPHIASTVNVEGDGNCGFRSVAVALGFPENQWGFIRKELQRELTDHFQFYEDMFGTAGIKMLNDSLPYKGLGFAPESKWMVIPETGVLIANRFDAAVIFLTHGGPVTYFPMWKPPPEHEPHLFVNIAFVQGNHYIYVKMFGKYPIHPTGNYFKRAPLNGKLWSTLYRERMQAYRDATNNALPMDHVPQDDVQEISSSHTGSNN